MIRRTARGGRVRGGSGGGQGGELVGIGVPLNLGKRAPECVRVEIRQASQGNAEPIEPAAHALIRAVREFTPQDERHGESPHVLSAQPSD